MKTVLVTGANRGLGLGFCQQYFAQGDLVIAVCRPSACQKALLALKALDDKRIRILCADLHSQASISQLAANVSGNYTLDVLINNAGVSANEPFGQWTQEAFVDNFMVNSIAPSLLCQALIDSLASRAKVIQLSSGVASISHSNQFAQAPLDAYAMSKAALNMFTRRLALQLNDTEKVICAISPGWVQTDMGGQDATSTVQEAVGQIIGLISSLNKADNGTFMDEKGTQLPW
ncbi:MAG: SDR family oxidoreductase [Paraglaciecola chathamensis]